MAEKDKDADLSALLRAMAEPRALVDVEVKEGLPIRLDFGGPDEHVPPEFAESKFKRKRTEDEGPIDMNLMQVLGLRGPKRANSHIPQRTHTADFGHVKPTAPIAMRVIRPAHAHSTGAQISPGVRRCKAKPSPTTITDAIAALLPAAAAVTNEPSTSLGVKEEPSSTDENLGNMLKMLFPDTEEKAVEKKRGTNSPDSSVSAHSKKVARDSATPDYAEVEKRIEQMHADRRPAKEGETVHELQARLLRAQIDKEEAIAQYYREKTRQLRTDE